MKDGNDALNEPTAPENRRMRLIALANLLGVPLVYWVVFILIPSMMMTEISGTLIDSGHYLKLGRTASRRRYSSITTHVFLLDRYNSPVSVKEINHEIAPGLSNNLQKYKSLSGQYTFEGHRVGMWVMGATLARLNKNPLSDAEKEANLDLLEDRYTQNDKGFAKKVRDGRKLREQLPPAYGLILDGTVIEGPQMSLWNHLLQRWVAIFAGLWWLLCFVLFLKSFPRLNQPWKMGPRDREKG